MDNFPDPENKIKIKHSQYNEKEHQSNEYIGMIDITSDYIWHIDCDEIYKKEDIEKIIQLLKEKKYTKVGFKTYSFFGGFNNYIGGYVENAEFIRIYKYKYGAYWSNHRPPTLYYVNSRLKPIKQPQHKYLTGEELDRMGIRIYHYSWVFINQVKEKMSYYKNNISLELSIGNYFYTVYMPWVLGDYKMKELIEKVYIGVHEYKPHIRGDAYTKKFNISHPYVIQKNMDLLLERYNKEINEL